MRTRNISLSTAIVLLIFTFVSSFAMGADLSQAQIDQATKEVNRSYRKEVGKKLMQPSRESAPPAIIPPGASPQGEYTTSEHR